MSEHSATAEAVLFDMDGTLLDSTPAVEATWDEFSQKHGLDLTEVLRTTHGVRTIDNLRRLSGITDEEELQAAVEAFESNIVSAANRLQSEGKNGLVILPGVHDILGELQRAESHVWAIVTSATTVYSSKAMPTAGVPTPPKLITGDMCVKGKPDPEPYLRGAEALGKDPTKCIVVEDAPSGIRSGRAAGCRVLAVCTSHERSQLVGLGATWIVTDLTKVSASVQKNGDIHLVIDQS